MVTKRSLFCSQKKELVGLLQYMSLIEQSQPNIHSILKDKTFLDNKLIYWNTQTKQVLSILVTYFMLLLC